MASNQALILYDANRVVARTEENSRQERGRWALIFSRLSPSPGRTMDEVYTAVGRALEKQANRAAHALGLGPHVVAQKIKSYFGNGEERVQRVAVLRTSVPPKLEKRCLKLMTYSLPTESANTQYQVFKEIVDLVTLFPGLRVIFLSTKCLDKATTMETVSTLWDRLNGTSDKEWTFWQAFSATCLTDTTISAILEESPVPDLFNCQGECLSPIERLLMDCSGTSMYRSALCIRYLGGILDLPAFWLDMGKVHSYVADKLCSGMIRVLRDIGVDVLALGPIEELEAAFDFEGVDFLATTILTGISGWFNKLDQEDWATQPWYSGFSKVLQLLRRPRATELLPRSSASATTDFENILPTKYQDAKLNVMVDHENQTTENQNTFQDNPLEDLYCKNNSATSIHSTISDEDDDHSIVAVVDNNDSQSPGTETNTQQTSELEADTSDKESHHSIARDNADVHNVGGTESGHDSSQGLYGNLANETVEVRTPQQTASPVLNETWLRQIDERKLALWERQRELGDDHSDTLDAKDSLADTHYEFGQFRLARDLLIEVLEKRRIILGEDHPDTLQTMDSLAWAYFSLGQYPRAERLTTTLLQKHRQLLGEDHPHTLRTMRTLASTFRELGRLNEAESLTVRVLEKQRQTQGEAHPATLSTMHNLALTYFSLEQFIKAESLQVQVLEKRREVLGEDHLDTLRAMENLAATYIELDQLSTAEELAAVALTRQRKALGEDHPDTLFNMGILAWAYQSQGRFEQAEELYVPGLEKWRKIVGDDHPRTIWGMHKLALTYRGLGKEQEAQELEAVLSARQ